MFWMPWRMTQIEFPPLPFVEGLAFCNHGGKYRFEKKINKYSEEINPLQVHRNMRGCVLEVNAEGPGY